MFKNFNVLFRDFNAIFRDFNAIFKDFNTIFKVFQRSNFFSNLAFRTLAKMARSHFVFYFYIIMDII